MESAGNTGKGENGIRGFSAAPRLHSAGCQRIPLRAQAAVEMLAYASFFLLAFVATMALFFQLQGQELERAEHAYAQEIAYEFSDHIHTAFVAGPGFVENVTLARDILGKNYNISISRKMPTAANTAGERETGFVYIDWRGPNRDSSFSAPTITTSYGALASGCVSINGEGFIVISPGTLCTRVQIRNIGGTIYLG